MCPFPLHCQKLPLKRAPLLTPVLRVKAKEKGHVNKSRSGINNAVSELFDSSVVTSLGQQLTESLSV